MNFAILIFSVLISVKFIIGKPAEFEVQTQNSLQNQNENLQNANRTRIINGNNAWRHQFPYIISLSRLNQHVCGGSILNQKFILTAAHCVNANRQYTIRAGINNLNENGGTEQVSRVTRIINHPNYGNRPVTTYDFSILEINPPLRLIPGIVERIRIPNQGNNQVSTLMSKTAGWGQTGFSSTPNSLQTVNLPLVPLGICRSLVGNLPETIICAGGQGSVPCFGDSGGPLICQDLNNQEVLCGVASFVFGAPSSCSTEYPAAFGRTSVVTNWINQNSNMQSINNQNSNNLNDWFSWNFG